MAFARTILAFLIAASVAMLPATGGAGLKVASELAGASAFDPAHDCCPPDADPCKQRNDCTTMAACALKCFNFTTGCSAALNYSLTLSSVIPSGDWGRFLSHDASPPFRPPRA